MVYLVSIDVTDDLGNAWQVVQGSVTAKLDSPRVGEITCAAAPFVSCERTLHLSRTVNGRVQQLGRFVPQQVEKSLGEAKVALGGMGSVVAEQRAAVQATADGDARTVLAGLLSVVPDYSVQYGSGVLSGVNVSGLAWDDRWTACVDLAARLGGSLTEYHDRWRVRRVAMSTPMAASVLDYTLEQDRSQVFNAVTAIGTHPAGAGIWFAYAEDMTSIARYGKRMGDPVEVTAFSQAETQDAADEYVRRNAVLGTKRSAVLEHDTDASPGDTVRIAGIDAVISEMTWPLHEGWIGAELLEEVDVDA